MQIYQVKGFKGALAFGLAVVGVAILSVLLPSFLAQVFWNAIVFEGFSGPEIGLLQGALLWAAVLILFKLIANPQISFQFKKMNDHNDSDHHLGS